ncbi:MAG TPA: hypothetical protein DCS17_01700 [Flavobacterium sp.]|nr:hypothetical protein [Flavobacterium sp.]
MAKKHRNRLEKYDSNRKSTKDRRKKETWAVFSYIEVGTGDEYRKSFTAPAGTSEVEMWKLAPKIID